MAFTERELAERFVTSAWSEEFALVKGSPAELFIEALGMMVETDWVAQVLMDPNPPHEWGEGRFEGHVADAAELHTDLKEAYSDFPDD